MSALTIPTKVILPDSSIPGVKDIYLSHSIDGLMEYCPRKFEFTQLYKQMPPPESRPAEAEALKVGTIMHEAAQAWLRARHTNPDNAIDAAYYTLALLWDMYRTKREEAIRPLGAAAQLILHMDQDPFWNDWELCEIDGYGLAIEVPFRIQHISPDIPEGYRIFTQGKADSILRNRRTNEVRMLDFKTTTQPSAVWEALYRFSDQAPIYDVPVKAVMGQPLGKTTCTYYMLSFSKPIAGDEDEIDEDSGVHQDFLKTQALTFEYSDEDIAEFLLAKNDKVRQLIRYLNDEYFPRRTHGCVMYNNPCAFFEVCGWRNHKKLEQWFSFERWEEASRVYEPLWTFQSKVE